MRKYIVGITGGIATGKTNVTDALRNAGAHVVDADEISRSLTKDNGEALPDIYQLFGEKVFVSVQPDMILDRKALGNIIFSDADKKAQLEKLLHPWIIRRCQEEMHSSPHPIVFLSAPLLYECGMEKLCDEVWCTYLPEDMQIARLMNRDQISEQDARARMNSQMPAGEKRDRAQLVIDTRFTREESAQQALQAFRALKERID